MDVLNKKGAEKRSDDMNDDTVPDVGMTVGLYGARAPSQGWRKCLLAALALAAFCANAKVEMIGGIEWEYSVDDDGNAEISSALDYSELVVPCYVSGSVIIPSMLGGCPVTSIGRRAFYGCDELVSVTIPEGIKTIGVEAFGECGRLLSVSIPDSVTTIKVDAFNGCSSDLYDQSVILDVKKVDGWIVGRGSVRTLRSLNLGDARGLAEKVFNGDRYLELVTIPGGIPSVPAEAFCGCRNLECVVFLGSVGEIGISAFEDCMKLVEIKRFSGATNIAAKAFSGCVSLERIIIPSTVDTIGDSAFYGCESLCDVEFQGERPKIGDNAFARTKVDIDSGAITVVKPHDGDDEDVPEYETALAGAADGRLLENITNDAQYAAFLAWAGGLENTTIETVRASPNAWLSYALDSASLIATAPSSGDVRIARFLPSLGSNAFDLSVSVAGVPVGSAATVANLAKVFAVEGAETPTEGLFSTNNVNVVFSVPADGLVRLSVSPKDLPVKSFFFRVKLLK